MVGAGKNSELCYCVDFVINPPDLPKAATEFKAELPTA